MPVTSAHTFRAFAYGGHVLQKGVLMRCMDSKNGCVEFAPVEETALGGPSLTHAELQDPRVKEDNVKEESSSQIVKTESTANSAASLDGTSIRHAIEIEDSDDGEDADAILDEGGDERAEGPPLAPTIAQAAVPNPDMNSTMPSSSTSSPSARAEIRKDTKCGIRAGRPTKQEILDMVTYIFDKGPQVDMTLEESWKDFFRARKGLSIVSRPAKNWLRIYVNGKNRAEIDDKVKDLRGE